MPMLGRFIKEASNKSMHNLLEKLYHSYSMLSKDIQDLINKAYIVPTAGKYAPVQGVNEKLESLVSKINKVEQALSSDILLIENNSATDVKPIEQRVNEHKRSVLDIHKAALELKSSGVDSRKFLARLFISVEKFMKDNQKLELKDLFKQWQGHIQEMGLEQDDKQKFFQDGWSQIVKQKAEDFGVSIHRASKTDKMVMPGTRESGTSPGTYESGGMSGFSLDYSAVQRGGADVGPDADFGNMNPTSTGYADDDEFSEPLGDCFAYAWKYIKNMNDDNLQLVHGLVHNPYGKAVEHAWVEEGGYIVDWQTMHIPNRPVFSIAQFYKAFKPTNVKKYTTEEALINAVKSGHSGPWTDVELAKKKTAFPDYFDSIDNALYDQVSEGYDSHPTQQFDTFNPYQASADDGYVEEKEKKKEAAPDYMEYNTAPNLWDRDGDGYETNDDAEIYDSFEEPNQSDDCKDEVKDEDDAKLTAPPLFWRRNFDY